MSALGREVLVASDVSEHALTLRKYYVIRVLF
jgi:hypothetical protein